MGHTAAELTRWPNDTSSRWKDGASPEQGGAGSQTVTRTSDSDTLLHTAPRALRTLFRAVPDSKGAPCGSPSPTAASVYSAGLHLHRGHG